MELIYKGAEAELYKDNYLEMPCVIKKRIRKSYKIEEIDNKIRTERIKRETNNLVRAKNAINCPYVYDVDMKEMSITMEYIDGKKLKEIIEANPQLGEDIGKAVHTMHEMNMIHGDLTTSNLILKNNKIYFIDFGLAQHSDKTEDKAVDLQVFRNVIQSTHHSKFEEIWNSFLKGYADEKVLKKLEEVDKRARYR